MDDYPWPRQNSAGVGSSRRSPKRPRTEISRDDSPGTGPSSLRAARPGSVRSGPPHAGTNTVTVPGSVLLPNRDSQGRRTVIDLTDDSPPRRQPEIIDVDALPDRPSSYFDYSNASADDEDYRLLLSRRRYPRPAAFGPPPARPVEPNLNPNPLYHSRPYIPRYNPEVASPILGQGARTVHEFGANINANSGGVRQNLIHLLGMFGNPQRAFDFSIQGRGTIQMNGFHPPGQLDYRLGVNGILGETPPVEDAVRRREAEYKAPKSPKEGFTRSPTTNDVLVCPSCEHELGTHSEEEGQATVWLGKCGHVYCGKCAAVFRAIPARAKKPKGGHMGQCEIEGCGQNLRGRGIWEIFL